MLPMNEYKYIIASIVVHGLVFSSMLINWNWTEKQEYMDSDVLLMGPKTGDKINPPKPKSDKKITKPVDNDPNAVKEYDPNASTEEQSEGTFGQGGTKELDYNTELGAWLQANKKYPKLARRLGQECDNIVVEFNIYPDGRLDDVIIKEKCQYDVLNQAAIDLVKASSPFKPFPANFPKTAIKRVQPFSFKLVD
ncbi:MAG: energy transducer TonB [Bdellovibrionaceae bacterium]|nr:energy transducer TonB [Pseudobdellovibrionaceae bacterium]